MRGLDRCFIVHTSIAWEMSAPEQSDNGEAF
jgi:hypothetical protein